MPFTGWYSYIMKSFKFLYYQYLYLLQNPIPTNKPGVDPKRPPRPVNITPLIKLNPSIPNTISVSWATEYGRGYVMSVMLVHKLNSGELLQRLKQRGIKHSDFTRGLSKILFIVLSQLNLISFDALISCLKANNLSGRMLYFSR